MEKFKQKGWEGPPTPHDKLLPDSNYSFNH